jgi:NTE family protein
MCSCWREAAVWVLCRSGCLRSSRVRTRDVLRITVSSVIGLIGLRDHLVRADGLRSLLERELPCRRFEATAIPLHVVATEQHTGDRRD